MHILGDSEVRLALEPHAAAERGVVELQARGVQAESFAAATIDVVSGDGAVEPHVRGGVYAQLVGAAREGLEEYARALSVVFHDLVERHGRAPSSATICRGRFS